MSVVLLNSEHSCFSKFILNIRTQKASTRIAVATGMKNEIDAFKEMLVIFSIFPAVKSPMKTNTRQ